MLSGPAEPWWLLAIRTTAAFARRRRDGIQRFAAWWVLEQARRTHRATRARVLWDSAALLPRSEEVELGLHGKIHPLGMRYWTKTARRAVRAVGGSQRALNYSYKAWLFFDVGVALSSHLLAKPNHRSFRNHLSRWTRLPCERDRGSN